MRTWNRLALCGLVIGLSAGVAAPADPPPLLKPVVPGAAQVRVRLPIDGGLPKSMMLNAKLPGGRKNAQGVFEMLPVTVAIDTIPGKSFVSAQKLAGWGYPIPKNNEFVLPELIITGVQIAPKLEKGHDVSVRLTNVKLHVVDIPAVAAGTIFFCDLSITPNELFKPGERTAQPRVAFADKFIEFTLPGAGAKALNTSELPAPEIITTTEADLVPAAGATVVRNGLPVFAYASVNGKEAYLKANKSIAPINAQVASINNTDAGIIISAPVAVGCGVEIGKGEVTATGVEVKSQFVPGKVKELRLELMTGPDLKVRKDLVLKDVPVMIDKNATGDFIFLGQKFVQTHFKDGVYAAGTDGVWKLHGRVDPTALMDVKTRPKGGK